MLSRHRFSFVNDPYHLGNWEGTKPKGHMTRGFIVWVSWCSLQSTSLSALPRVVRDELPPHLIPLGQTTINWSDLTSHLKQKLWDRYNGALLPAQEKNKLGVVIFQVLPRFALICLHSLKASLPSDFLQVPK